MENKVRFAAYGTLRQGSYNYNRFKRYFGDSFNKIETITSEERFVMLDNGMYPYLTRKGNNPTPIVFDVIECDKNCWNSIHSMELGAGYELGQVILNGETYPIFLYEHEADYPQVTSGDWLEAERVY